MPHVPGQGFIHFWFIHAWLKRHSELVTHSGLQVGGLPINPSTQEHTAWPLISLHLLYGPHGEGLQGLLIGGATSISTVTFVNLNYVKST